MRIESVEDEKDRRWKGRTHRQIGLKLNLPWRQDVTVVAGQVAEFVLPVLFGRDEKVPRQQRRPNKE